jgi:hypothetical protein
MTGPNYESGLNNRSLNTHPSSNNNTPPYFNTNGQKTTSILAMIVYHTDKIILCVFRFLQM